jgi:hypothetical protein
MMKAMTMGLVTAALAVGVAGAAPASAAGTAWSTDFYLSGTGGSTKCLTVDTHRSKDVRWIHYYDFKNPRARVVWKGTKGSGWQNGYKMKTVMVDDGSGYGDTIPMVKKDRAMTTRLKGSNPRQLVYRTPAGTTKATPKLKKVTFTSFSKAGCPLETY